jgi:hypothetical protein
MLLGMEGRLRDCRCFKGERETGWRQNQGRIVGGGDKWNDL